MIPPAALPTVDEQYSELFKRRPEQLGVSDFVELTNIIKNIQKQGE